MRSEVQRHVLLPVLAVVIAAIATGCRAGETAPASRPAEPAGDKPMNTETATFAAGCFWGVQAGFDLMDGVVSTTVGYTGGHTANPTYEDVCSHKTGHAEAVEIVFDPARASYEKLLDYFFRMHDPTTPNRQGPDVGSQYRSAIFFHSPEQERAARAYVTRLTDARKFARPIVTEITPAGRFHKAEEYHQKYFAKTGRGACHVMP